jgi:hypothetical protein
VTSRETPSTALTGTSSVLNRSIRGVGAAAPQTLRDDSRCDWQPRNRRQRRQRRRRRNRRKRGQRRQRQPHGRRRRRRRRRRRGRGVLLRRLRRGSRRRRRSRFRRSVVRAAGPRPWPRRVGRPLGGGRGPLVAGRVTRAASSRLGGRARGRGARSPGSCGFDDPVAGRQRHRGRSAGTGDPVTRAQPEHAGGQ